MSRRAQERVLLAQVGREIQANLRHMEQVLDAFFRDHGKRAELATLERDGDQIRGALKLLGLDDAERLLGLCQAQIATYANADTPVDDVDLELLAESLSGLGFYVEAVEQQRPDRERLIAPLLAKRLGEAPSVEVPAGETVEAAVEELRGALPALVAEMHRAPLDAAARDTLKARLGDLRDDAKLIDDGELIAQAEGALRELESGSTAALEATVTAIAGAPAPAPVISDETQRLLAIEATGLDAELLDIYLAEAQEVLDTVVAQLGVLRGNFGDREALRTVRRQFHTLKGSGRMVGLTELGELAWHVEKIHNRLLEEERAVTPTVLALIAEAESDYRRWVTELRTAGRVVPDPTHLHAAIRDVEAELPGNRESVLAPAAAAVPEPAAIAPPVVEIAAPEGPSQPAVAYAPEPFPAVAELPELGNSAEACAPIVEAMHAEDEHLLEEIDVGSADIPSAEPLSEERDADVAAHVPPPTDEVVIGDVSISAVLYSILVDEADQHLATLAHEMSLLQSDPQHLPSGAMVRASHTLCGIHRTGGFPLIATTAKSLEQCLLGMPDLELEARGSALPVVARAVQCVTDLVQRIEERGGFTADDVTEAAAVEGALEVLRQQALAATAAAVAVAIEPAPETDETEVVEAKALEAEPDEAVEAEAVEAEMQAALDEVYAEHASALRAASGALDEIAPEAAAPVAAEPQAEGVAEPAPALADVRDEIDAQLLPIFLEEAAELFPRAGEQLRAWRRMSADATAANQLRRTLHTFKGSARMAGAMRLGELCHLMESRFVADDMLAAGTVELFEALDTDLDHIAFVLDALREGRVDVELPWMAAPANAAAAAEAESRSGMTAESECPAPVAAPVTLEVATDAAMSDGELPGEPAEAVSIEPPHAADASIPAEPSPLGPVPEAVSAAEQTAPVVVPLPSSAPANAPSVHASGRSHAESGVRAMLRVRADIIDRLANEAGEVAIARARIEGELRALKANLLELTASVIRLRSQVREIEIQAESQISSGLVPGAGGAEGFDPLEFDRYTRFQELTRSLAESVNDVSTVQQALLKNFDDADAALAVQGRLSRDVQQQLFAIRTVPFGSLAERLYRLLRATGKELDRRANLEIRGGQTELDRSVLEKMAGPLEHLLRNAVAHGIEPQDVRARIGKPRTGEITLTAGQAGNEIVIELADDGAGLNLDEIHAKGVAMGRFAPGARPTDAQLVECIFEPGFSTASKVTQVAGRGIGMDVVRAEINALGGRVEVATRAGQGTTFTLYLPLTLAVAQVVLARAAGRLWALPAPMVEKVQQFSAEELAERYAARCVAWQDASYPLHYLPRLLADAHSTPEVARHNPVLLLRAGSNLAAVHVDEMVGNQEVVVKNIGPQLARVSGIAGATVLGTGEIVLIINAVQLAQRADVPGFDETVVRVAPVAGESAPKGVRPRPLVMVVDDSLTVRKITSRLLQREGYKVLTAKDGVEALEVLEEETPDAILLDIEMPRMDGFEFARTVKGERRTAGIPIVMITSRIAEKHRNRARELGVDRYLGKPYQEAELLGHLRELLAVTA
jgi:chemosensory pili system protein ChpA (sensor histidine kinase/response regulator)